MADSGNVAPQSPWGGTLKNKPAVPDKLFTAPGSAPAHALLAHEPRPDGIERLDGRRIFVAVSPAMREVRRQVEQVAGIDAVVLLLGESGTGKEVIARMIHKLSSRSARKFLKVNCAALPLELLESELFGHEAGAFTGARQARAGKFEICHKGTILLDEIAEMPVSPQAKLLHVLQDGEFSRLGSACTIQSDVRVLAATNVDVRQRGAERNPARRSLLPAQRFHHPAAAAARAARRSSPPAQSVHEHLGRQLWASAVPITRRILEACASYPWPGNVRELENFVKRYLVLGDEKLAVSQLDFRPSAAGDPVWRAEGGSQVGKPGSCDLKSLVKDLKKDAERAAIVQALEQTGGNRQDAASLAAHQPARLALQNPRLWHRVRLLAPAEPFWPARSGGPRPAHWRRGHLRFSAQQPAESSSPMDRAGERGGWPPRRQALLVRSPPDGVMTNYISAGLDTHARPAFLPRNSHSSHSENLLVAWEPGLVEKNMTFGLRES